MKKAIIASILCLSSIWTGMAQSKGDMALGGDLGLSTTQMIHTKEAGGYYLNHTQHYGTTFTIAPKFSYFAADNFEMDLSVGYTLSGDFFGDGEFMHVLDGSIGMHYYVHIIRDRFFYTPGFNLSFGGVKSVEVRDNGERFSQDGMPFVFGADLELGRFEFKANRHWGFSANLLTLQIATTTGITAYDRSTSIGVNLNCGITLGTMYYF